MPCPTLTLKCRSVTTALVKMWSFLSARLASPENIVAGIVLKMIGKNIKFSAKFYRKKICPLVFNNWLGYSQARCLNKKKN
jgi:hypothetical protein